MSYATRAQALSYCGRLAKTTSDNTYPSLSDLDQFIADRAQIIDSALKSRGLVVPITAPAEFVSELAALNAHGASADMMNAAYITNDGNDRGAGAILLKEFMARVNQFYAGLGIPVTVAVAEADLAPRSFATDAGAIGQPGVDAWGNTVNSTPMFSIGRTF